MKFTVTIEGESLESLRAVFPVDNDYLRLTKRQMDELIDEHAMIYGMSETLRKISTLTGETTIYNLAIGKWPLVYAKLQAEIAKKPDMPLFEHWTTEVA